MRFTSSDFNFCGTHISQRIRKARSTSSTISARASAMIYSLVETAKANYLNVYQYLELLLIEIPKHMNDTNLSFLDELLPWAPGIQEKCPSRYKKS